MKSIFEEMGGTYSDISGYLIPNLAMPELPPLGKYGPMRRRYLKEHRPVLLSSLILSGKLYRHLAELNDQAQARLEVIIRQMQRSEGVDERMKAQDLMLWVGRMNSIRERAEEIILAELIFI